MKSIIRMLSLALVLTVLLMPVSALAGDGKLKTVTASNFSLTVNDQEPILIGVTAKATVGMDDDRCYLAGDITGGQASIANFKAAMEDELLTLSLDGLSDNYVITQAELQALIEQSTGDQAAAMPFDQEDIQKLVESYMALLESSKAADKQNSIEMFSDMGFVLQPEPEQVEVMGETMELQRVDVKMGLADLDKMMQVLMEQTPEAKAFLEEYFKFLEKLMQQSGAEMELDVEHLFESLYKDMGMDLSVEATVWTDDKGENMRMDMVENMSVTEGNVTTTVSVPFMMQVKTDAEGAHMLMNMDMEQDGVKMAMSMGMNTAADDNAGDFTMNITAQSEDAEPVAIDLSGSYAQDENGDNRHFQGSLNVDAEGDTALITLKVDGTGAKGEARQNHIELGVTASQGGENLLTCEFGFDLDTEQADMPEGALDMPEKPAVKITEMDEEQLQKLQTEGMTAVIMGYGALMQDEGVAKLMSGALTSVMSVFLAPDQSEITGGAEVTSAA